MTHPLTPREKVLLKPCPFCGGDAVAGSNFDNDHYVMCGADCDKCGGMVGYMKTEMAAIENWNRRTALASGSGDHAELERLAEAATARLAGHNLNADGFGLQIWGDSLKGGRTHVLDVRGWGYLTGGGHGALGLTEDEGIAAQRAIQAYAVAAWNAAPALLAEIAALRGERDGLKNRVSCLERLGGEQSTRVMQQATRAKEAERKLAEAMGLLREWMGTWFVDADSRGESAIADDTRKFLSKEAERG